MVELRAVCVFSGSSSGGDDRYAAVAEALGRLLAERGLTLVYGGAEVGLMGTLADAALAAGGEVVGVIPRGLFTREIAHRGLTELVEVRSMHERKAHMYDRSDAFIALPGGFGTLDELFEAVTWSQLGIHAKPSVLLDVDGFWDPLVTQLDAMAAAGFLRPENRQLLQVRGSPEAALAHLEGAGPGAPEPWITAEER
ncbi:MAG TPA: TIGR00730 family Rossman fold protein [Acidimicrobiales bacterium]|nr:TIGR00730 family Rossman fold protein [Acidimicrobiales bacterium]